MQQSSANPPSSAPSSFAGLLASLTAPTPRTAWNNDDLAEDVATLSYEHALRAHARYSTDDAGEWAFPPPAAPAVAPAKVAPQIDPAASAQDWAAAAPAEPSWAKTQWGEEAEATQQAANATMTLEQSKKCASITIRLSKTECDQLRRRASQAGLTVSAYLRSCTFEAEALRAQVKDVLAELRTATAPHEQSAPVVPRRSHSHSHSWFDWFQRLMPRGHSTQRVARA